MPLPTDRTASDTIEEHVDDHNTLATQHNELEGHAADTSVHGIADTSALSLNTHDHDTDYEPLGAAAAAAAAVVDAAPGALDTLNELAAALGDDANYASTVTTALAGKASTSHHTSHEPGGSDTMAADAAAGTASLRSLGTGATQAAAGNDARLSDTRTPTDGSVTNAKVDAAAAIAETKLSLASDAAAGTASRRSLGSGATQAAAGNHAHSGTYVPLSTIDAAGDLLVGDADNSVTRLAKGSALQVLRVNAGATALEYATSSGASTTAVFGDGADGVVNFDGTTTVLGLAPSSGVYTLTRDIYLAGGSQVSGTAVVIARAYRIFCSGTFTVGSTATVHADGPAGVGSAGGDGGSTGTVLLGGIGGAGNAGAGGGSGTNITPALGGAGGAGGASSGGGVGGGSAGGTVTRASSAGNPRTYANAFITAFATQWKGGGGGTGGNAAASSTGGGGGAGGSILYIAAWDLVITGTVRANGGNGGNASGAGTGAGGGGGGGGGALVMIYHTKSGAGSTLTAATNTAGGTGGALQGAGRTGATASNGNIFELVM